MSECQLIANQLSAKVPLPPHALGYAPDDIELKLCDDEGDEVPDGEVGPALMRRSTTTCCSVAGQHCPSFPTMPCVT